MAHLCLDTYCVSILGVEWCFIDDDVDEVAGQASRAARKKEEERSNQETGDRVPASPA